MGPFEPIGSRCRSRAEPKNDVVSPEGGLDKRTCNEPERGSRTFHRLREGLDLGERAGVKKGEDIDRVSETKFPSISIRITKGRITEKEISRITSGDDRVSMTSIDDDASTRGDFSTEEDGKEEEESSVDSK